MQLVEAVNLAIASFMETDERSLYFGEDVKTALRGFSQGLSARFGEDRIRECPISEQAFVGTAIGAALQGRRVIVDLQISSLVYVAFDQIVDQALKIPSMLGGGLELPILFIIPTGSRDGLAGQHSDNPYALLSHMGMRCLMPNTPQEAYDLTVAALRASSPTSLFVPVHLMARSAEVIQNELSEGIVSIVQESHGSDATVITNGTTSSYVSGSVNDLSLSIDHFNFLDLRPANLTEVLRSVAETQKVLVIDDSNEPCGWGESIIARIATSIGVSNVSYSILARKEFVVPFSHLLEKEVVVQKDRIQSTLARVVKKDVIRA